MPKAANVGGLRCGGILCSVRRRPKPNDELMYKFISTAQ